jgi:serine protease AprX
MAMNARQEDPMDTSAHRRPLRRLPALVALALVAGMAGAATVASVAPSLAAAGRDGDAPTTYLVRTAPEATDDVAHALGGGGAEVEQVLRGVHHVVARMRPSVAARAAELPGVVHVSADVRVELAGAEDSGESDSAGTSGTSDPSDDYDPVTDPASMYTISRIVGASSLWGDTTGRGVDVALLDSGVTPVHGLDAPGKLVNGPDLSFESQNGALRSLDTYGHGTHMAGIIAGRDTGVVPSVSAAADGAFLGIAPRARIVSVKLADAYGATDVSQVIAGIDWVVQHARDDGFNIRVINLSFGTDSDQDAVVDPLSYAAEVAWRSGIVVVASAGNGGGETSRLANPAINPWIIAVGANDPRGTRLTDDDVVPGFTSRGDGVRDPDLVAAGVHVQSLRVPGSHIDDTFGAPAGEFGERFLRGSGTSQAAAVVSGAVALLVEERPYLTPDQVKALLRSTTRAMPGEDTRAVGRGALDVRRATRTLLPPLFVQSWERSTGRGSLDAARAKSPLVLDGVALDGEIDIFGASFDSSAHADRESDAAAWDGGTWNGRRWAGDGWSGATWQSATWTTGSWAGSSWSGGEWNDASWTGRRWADASWHGRRWASSQWAATNDTARNWTVEAWR